MLLLFFVRFQTNISPSLHFRELVGGMKFVKKNFRYYSVVNAQHGRTVEALGNTTTLCVL